MNEQGTRFLSERLDKIAEFASQIAAAADSDFSGSSGRSTPSHNQRVQTIRSLSSSPKRPSPLAHSSSGSQTTDDCSVQRAGNDSRHISSQARSGLIYPNSSSTDPDSSTVNIRWQNYQNAGSSHDSATDGIPPSEEILVPDQINHEYPIEFPPHIDGPCLPLYACRSATDASRRGSLLAPTPKASSFPYIGLHTSICDTEEYHRPCSVPSETSPLLPLYHSNMSPQHFQSPINISISMPASPVQTSETRQISTWATSAFPNIWAPLLETILLVTPRQWMLAGVALIYLGHYSSEDLRNILQPVVCFVASLLQISLGVCPGSNIM